MSGGPVLAIRGGIDHPIVTLFAMGVAWHTKGSLEALSQSPSFLDGQVRANDIGERKACADAMSELVLGERLRDQVAGSLTLSGSQLVHHHGVDRRVSEHQSTSWLEKP